MPISRQIKRSLDSSKIRIETKHTTIDVLIKRLRNKEIDISPDFRRSSVIWKDDAQSRLIESMLIGIPLPTFYMDATDDNKWIVVDGLQRLTTVKLFAIDESLTLSSMDYLFDLKGKKFSELLPRFQRLIEDTEIIIYLIQPGIPFDVKFNILRRINPAFQLHLIKEEM